MTNIFELQNIPRLADTEKATYGLPSIRESHRNGHHYLSFWDGQSWADYGVDDGGELCDPYDDWFERTNPHTI